MAVRRWAVRPDQPFQLDNGEQIGVVSRQAIVEAIMDGEAILARAGGVLTVMVSRHPTGLDGEMVTTSAIVEWKDRTDARPQPERPHELFTPPAPVVEDESIEQPEIVEAAPASAPSDGEAPDGFDESRLEDEDVESIPVEMR